MPKPVASFAKLAVIVHCWGGTPTMNWYPWLHGELQARGYTVLVPTMPNTEAPAIADWVGTLQQLLAEHTADELVLIGHSIGCQTIIRSLASGAAYAQLALFVAGWTSLTGLATDEVSTADPWLTTSIDTITARANLKASVALFSKDDPLVPLSNQDFFNQQLGSQIVVLDGYGHFHEDSGIRKLPELLVYL